MPKSKELQSLDAGSHSNGAPPKTAEDRRLAARRRFLQGGAAALPVLVTLGHKEALAASIQVCMSANVGRGVGLTDLELKALDGGVETSIFCRF